jgi:transketolase
MSKYGYLIEKARQLRKRVIDLALEKNGEAHLGGSFSEIEILLALYKEVLKDDDKFILSKGHCCYPLYLLLKEEGYDPTISGHPDLDEKNGISCTTGSLGHGLPMGVGMALAKKRLGKPGRIYVGMSDGECQEGTTWESALLASHHKLDNLTVVVDRNYLQALENTEKVLALGDLEKKFDAFGWSANTVDGHCFDELIPTLKKVETGKPRIVIARTIKGKGVSYMENNPDWHGRRVTPERVEGAYKELGEE